MSKELETITRKVLSYCAIPEKITEEYSHLQEAGPDCYLEWEITPKEERHKFDDDFQLDDWILENYVVAEGEKIFIHIDY